MSDQSIPLERWSDVAKVAISEIATSSLGCEARIDDGSVETEPGHWGSLVALVSGRNATCVGVSATPEGCRTIAGAMLGMDATESAELSHDDVRDSIGEIANILAGVMKGRLTEEDPALTLGLPLFIDGIVEGDRRSRALHIVCNLGDTRCLLTLLVGWEQRAAA
ncbi:MAG: chemotaxis protein CheX [Deltaproteobacteria bacterium]|nr:chemotaxis protein CheX [Nannocystaceae bacterium]